MSAVDCVVGVTETARLMLGDPEISLRSLDGVFPDDALVCIDLKGRLQKIHLSPSVYVDRSTVIEMMKAGAIRVSVSGWETYHGGSYSLGFFPPTH